MTQTNSQVRPSEGMKRGEHQLDPNSKNGFDYTVYVLTATVSAGTPVIAQALSVGTNHNDYQSGEEYWNLSSGFLAAFANGTVTQLQLVATSGHWSTQPNPPSWGGSDRSPTVASRASWDLLSPQTPPSGTLFSGNKGIHLSGTSGAPVVSWYILATTGLATGTYAVDENGATFVVTTPPPATSGMQWYKADPV